MVGYVNIKVKINGPKSSDETDTGSAFGTDRFGRLAMPIYYNPYNDGHFFYWLGGAFVTNVFGARAVVLNKYGMTGCYLED